MILPLILVFGAGAALSLSVAAVPVFFATSR
jgi:hypothetical protein